MPDPTDHVESSSEESGTDAECRSQSDDADVQDDLEPWEDFVRRVTHNMEAVLASYQLEDWIVHHRRRKWSFAGRLARCTDGRWSNRLLTWIPYLGAGRGVGCPRARWDDCIVKLAGGDWANHSQDEHLWSLLSEAYVFREEVMETIAARV